MTTTLTSKPVTFFKPDPNQPRKSYDDGGQRALGESLKKKQIVPVLAKPDGTLIDGHRRWLAAKLVGLETLDVIITDETLTPAQIKEVQLVSALHRADLTPYEQYVGCTDWLALNPGATAKELAAKIDRDPSMLTRILSLSRCIPEVQAAAAEGALGPALWYAIAKAPAEQQAILLAAKLAGANRAALERFHRPENGEASRSDKMNRYKISLAGGTTVTVVGREMSLDGAIDVLQEVLKEAKKARHSGLDGTTFVRVMADKAKVRG